MTAQHLPDCMMPDGAEPCLGWQETAAEHYRLKTINAELLAALKQISYFGDHPSTLGKGDEPVMALGRTARIAIARATSDDA